MPSLFSCPAHKVHEVFIICIAMKDVRLRNATRASLQCELALEAVLTHQCEIHHHRTVGNSLHRQGFFNDSYYLHHGIQLSQTGIFVVVQHDLFSVNLLGIVSLQMHAESWSLHVLQATHSL